MLIVNSGDRTIGMDPKSTPPSVAYEEKRKFDNYRLLTSKRSIWPGLVRSGTFIFVCFCGAFLAND